MKWAMNGAMTDDPIIGGTPTDNLPALSSWGDSISSFSWVNPLMSSSILGRRCRVPTVIVPANWPI